MASSLSLFIGATISTPFGVSKIITIKKDSNNNIQQVICQPLEWILAQNQLPTFYLNPSDIKPIKNLSNPNSYVKNQNVMSQYGYGQLKKRRGKSDNICEVSLMDWTLANGKNPTLYCKLDNIQKFNAGARSIKSVDQIKEKVKEDPKVKNKKLIEDAKLSKESATILFQEKKYEEAKEQYIKAIQVTQYLGDDLDNDERAEIFEITVPCHNNIALCCINIKKYDEAVQFAKNSLIMVKSLESRMPDSLVWKSCLQRGLTEEKIFIETKKKSLFYMGKGNYLRKNYDEAIKQLEEALSLIAGDPNKEADANTIKQLLQQAKSNSKKESRKEMTKWSKAFEANNKLDENEIKSTPSSPKPNSQKNDKSSKGNINKNSIISDIFNIKKMLSGKDNDDDDDKFKIIKFDNSTYTWVLGFLIIGLGGFSFWRFRSRRF